MTTPYLAADISHDEGFSGEAYPDPLSPLAKALREGSHPLHGLSGDPWTCGYGCTGRDVRETTVWTEPEAAEARDRHIVNCVADLDIHAPWWRSLCDARQDVLVNMTYNMGWGRLSGFKAALAAMQAHDYERAAAEMLDSLWARQVHGRATRLAEQMRTGLRVAP